MGFFYNEDRKDAEYARIIFTILFILAGSIALLMAVVPQYKVWSNELRGKAQLREAEWSKQVQIQEAEGNLEAEKLNAQSEVARAKGAAEAIEIEGGSLTPEYIQYLWVRSNEFSEATTIYIPTETNLPILEATRL